MIIYILNNHKTTNFISSTPLVHWTSFPSKDKKTKTKSSNLQILELYSIEYKQYKDKINIVQTKCYH